MPHERRSGLGRGLISLQLKNVRNSAGGAIALGKAAALALAGSTVLVAAGVPAQVPAPSAIPDYSRDTAWLCLPGRSDPCSTPLATTALTPNGYGSTIHSIIAKDTPLDCFYVYPTVSRDQGMNSDLNVGPEEKGAALTQFARFASACRTYAPVYRQMTLAAVAAYSAGADIRDAAALAYHDVAAAWDNYILTRNHGRPFVLIGHSQGSLMLQMLIARKIETDPALAKRMKLAILPGFNVLVPQGRLVGGTFKKTPLCSRPGDTGCIISYVSFRENNVPPEGAMFGIADQPGMTVGCVNPARPGSTDWVPLDSYWFSRSGLPVPGGPIIWSAQGPPPSPYLETAGLVSAKCISDGARGYLWIRTNHKPGEKWTDHIGGEVGLLGAFLPGWGMHLSDVEEAQGDLVREVAQIAASSRR